MEFLAGLYTLLLVAICLMMALLLFRSGRFCCTAPASPPPGRMTKP